MQLRAFETPARDQKHPVSFWWATIHCCLWPISRLAFEPLGRIYAHQVPISLQPWDFQAAQNCLFTSMTWYKGVSRGSAGRTDSYLWICMPCCLGWAKLLASNYQFCRLRSSIFWAVFAVGICRSFETRAIGVQVVESTGRLQGFKKKQILNWVSDRS